MINLRLPISWNITINKSHIPYVHARLALPVKFLLPIMSFIYICFTNVPCKFYTIYLKLRQLWAFIYEAICKVKDNI